MPTRVEAQATVTREGWLSFTPEPIDPYTMNRADLVFAICHLTGLRAKPKVAGEAA